MKGGDLFPSERQQAFLLTNDVEHVLFGGATRGGKSLALLAGALQYMDVPGYNAILIRRSLEDLILPDALIPESHMILSGMDAHWNGSEHTWRFPGGPVLKFGYMRHRGDEQRYQGAAAQYWGFDEAGHLDPWQMDFLTSRASKVASLRVPIRFRYSANPGGPAQEWLVEQFVNGAPENGRLFIPSRAVDNPALDKEYLGRLDRIADPILRAQMRDGDWGAVDRSGLVCPEWTPELAALCTVDDDMFPPYFHAYAAADPGGNSKEQARDLFAMGWGHHDFNEGLLIVTDERAFRNANTADIGTAAVAVEKERWGAAKEADRIPWVRRVTDLDGRLVNDLAQPPYRLHWRHSEKTEAAVWERALRAAIQQGKVRIHRRCKRLLKTLQYARRTENGDYERTEETGHADLWKMLCYMFRSVEWNINPFPPPAQLRETQYARQAQQQPRTPAQKAMQGAFPKVRPLR